MKEKIILMINKNINISNMNKKKQNHILTTLELRNVNVAQDNNIKIAAIRSFKKEKPLNINVDLINNTFYNSNHHI